MTISAGVAPRHGTPLDLLRGLLTGAVIGVSLAGFVVGVVVERVPLFVTALVLPAVYGLLVFLTGVPRRAREAAVVPCTALGVIEDVEARAGRTTDVPVRFELTVVPDDAPAFRVRFSQDVHVSELPDYRPRGVVVVTYPPDRPWTARIVRRPTPRWEERAAAAFLDSAPGPVLESDEREGCAAGLVTLLALLLGAAAVVLLFRADLFGSGAEAGAPAASRSETSVVTSADATVSLGPGQSMLDPGELRRSVDALARGGTGHEALSVVVRERLLTVVFAPSDAKGTGFDLRSLPYDRIPGLVEEAGDGLGARRSWRVDAGGTGAAVTLRVTVTGTGGTRSLEADGRGDVVRRDGR
ncbi:hypothetical protein IAG44_03655 [Streptomyces roseirectus]|uniref:Uncharacterized protein n=1 Tax=Streptomyces roseirectus TaxID=2768066 RepID=A0A7H0I781_9ACTN|nr:hypothetical protein [Streptomyces roseirectus]QNP68647.1 hypothetical protein IAG44_03655 [Streptomyces roseirectus]